MAYPQTNGKPTYHEFISPIGLLLHMSHDKPMLKTNTTTKQPVMDENGIQEAEYRVTIAWEKARAQELQDLLRIAHQVKAEAWPQSVQPGAFFALEPFLRDGDNPAHNTKARDYLMGKYYMNCRQKAVPTKNPQTGQVIYSGAPGIIGPYNEDLMPLDIWSGCTGRISGILFGSEYMGRNFISSRLNNIQKYQEGERIGGVSRPDPKSQFSPLMQGSGGTLPNLL